MLKKREKKIHSFCSYCKRLPLTYMLYMKQVSKVSSHTSNIHCCFCPFTHQCRHMLTFSILWFKSIIFKWNNKSNFLFLISTYRPLKPLKRFLFSFHLINHKHEKMLTLKNNDRSCIFRSIKFRYFNTQIQ